MHRDVAKDAVSFVIGRRSPDGTKGKDVMMRTAKSYWQKYAEQRRAQRSAANLRRQRGVTLRRTIVLRQRPR